MAHTNRVRVILGGLLAGVVINVVEFVMNAVVLKDAWAQVMQSLGRPTQASAGSIVLFNVWGFVLGIGAVWVYAAIRPRYGAGPTTAIRAGLAAWVLAVLLADVINYAVGFVPLRMVMITGFIELVELVIATVVGAWVYKEEETKAETPASRAVA